jgi:SAM-dependent methyltransferase
VAQNIYDDEAFFTGYSALPRSVAGLDAAPEWPTLRAMLGPLHGRRVIDLGCGFGWFCRWAAAEGATAVHGVDLSARMLARACSETSDDRVTYERADLDDIELAPAAFDVAYSSLTLHYVADVERLSAQVSRCLVEGGAFVFSIEHPIFTAPSSPRFVADDDGVAWRLDRYLDEGPRTTDWLAPGVIKQHRTIAAYIMALRLADLDVTELVEWGPNPDQIAEHPDWAVETERPPFLLVAARRRV